MHTGFKNVGELLQGIEGQCVNVLVGSLKVMQEETKTRMSYWEGSRVSLCSFFSESKFLVKAMKTAIAKSSTNANRPPLPDIISSYYRTS